MWGTPRQDGKRNSPSEFKIVMVSRDARCFFPRAGLADFSFWVGKTVSRRRWRRHFGLLLPGEGRRRRGRIDLLPAPFCVKRKGRGRRLPHWVGWWCGAPLIRPTIRKDSKEGGGGGGGGTDDDGDRKGGGGSRKKKGRRHNTLARSPRQPG